MLEDVWDGLTTTINAADDIRGLGTRENVVKKKHKRRRTASRRKLGLPRGDVYSAMMTFYNQIPATRTAFLQ
jgi:hypothetical protein